MGGRFSPATLQWIENMLSKAASENKAVITMMHHGVLEHYSTQEKYYPDFIVDDYQTVSRFLPLITGRRSSPAISTRAKHRGEEVA